MRETCWCVQKSGGTNTKSADVSSVVEQTVPLEPLLPYLICIASRRSTKRYFVSRHSDTHSQACAFHAVSNAVWTILVSQRIKGVCLCGDKHQIGCVNTDGNPKRSFLTRLHDTRPLSNLRPPPFPVPTAPPPRPISHPKSSMSSTFLLQSSPTRRQ